MDVIFNIDGTLADISHRSHFINRASELKDWNAFFDGISDDRPISEIWTVLADMLYGHQTVILITDRPEKTRQATYDWLINIDCPYRGLAAFYWKEKIRKRPVLYMRKENDFRPSTDVKRDLLKTARDMFDPKLVFENCATDADMWRKEGLACCEVSGIL